MSLARYFGSLRRAARPFQLALLAVVLASPALAQSSCEGDCGADGDVTVDEILTLVAAALGSVAADACPAGDTSGDGMITVDEIVAALQRALNGCPVATTETWIISDFGRQFSGCPTVLTELIEMVLTPDAPCPVEMSFDGSAVIVTDCGGGMTEASIDENRVLTSVGSDRGQIDACEFRIENEVVANLSQSPTVIDFDILVVAESMCPFPRCEIDFAGTLTREAPAPQRVGAQLPQP